MRNLFKKKADTDRGGEENNNVGQEDMEHAAFAEWLAHQPDDRKQMYLKLAMAYGFRMHGTSTEGKENGNE